MKVKECTLTSKKIKEMMDKYKDSHTLVLTKLNIIERVIRNCGDKSDNSLI